MNEDRIKNLIKYSDPYNKKTLFVWPEGSSVVLVTMTLVFKKLFSDNFKDNHYIIFGTNSYDKDKNGFYNSMFLVNNRLEVIQSIKSKNFLFGEFLPFEKFLNRFGLKKLLRDMDLFKRENTK